MIGAKNQRNTEDANSEIRQTHFLVQQNKQGISKEYQNTSGIKW